MTDMKNVSRLAAVLPVLCLILSLTSIRVFSQTQSDDASRKTYKYTNGRWFDGKNFRRQTFY
jgi:hypothetical protein